MLRRKPPTPPRGIVCTRGVCQNLLPSEHQKQLRTAPVKAFDAKVHFLHSEKIWILRQILVDTLFFAHF